MNKRLTAISKEVSYALRHHPEEFGLTLDERGFADMDSLLAALNGKEPSRGVTREDLEAIIDQSEKKRHEIVGNRIRAIYGHSVAQRIKEGAAEPPAILYHGTSPEAAKTILTEGIKPMGRQYVHLSTDPETANSVGSRRAKKPVLLAIDAATAHRSGVAFYRGNDKVWLADFVPAEYMTENRLVRGE